ncbi:hypothetical protein TorRG33x02_148960 [Trema orientale]|uniref:Uncharacterized protein n=1 Tax=Trema orientale TaxID=63057 RepID=A0A2P5EUY8_TREOI|nr:hypothetical protein TorRG33x02_148960 [Trema orientale]
MARMAYWWPVVADQRETKERGKWRKWVNEGECIRRKGEGQVGLILHLKLFSKLEITVEEKRGGEEMVVMT